MSTPEEDSPAPLFTLDSTDAHPISLKDLRGQKVVLFFYPKDDTTTCTKEACNFRDAHADIKKTGAILLGISPDDLKSHAKFRKKYKLSYPLLADPDHTVAERYGVWGEKSMYGHTYMGILRTTFIIDSKGKIAKIFPKVQVKNHNKEVLEALAIAK